MSAAACADRNAGEGLTFERPVTAIDYDVTLEGAPDDEIDALLRQSLKTFRREEDGAQSPAFLRRRAQADGAIAATILRSRGYYQSSLDFEIEPAEGDRPALVRLTLIPGPRFLLARHGFVAVDDGGTPAPPLDAEALGSPVGAPARAAEILNAEGRAVETLRSDGRPYAKTAGRDAVADLEAHTLEVDSTISVGPYATFGPVIFEGLDAVEADYLLTYKTWEDGAPFDMAALREFQRALSETRLFDVVSATPPETAPETPPGGAPLPVVVRAEEALPRTVSAGVRFSTDLGPSARGTLEHRNLFGRNETGRARLQLGLEEQSLALDLRVPQYLRPGQDFLSAFEVRRRDLDAFEELAATLSAGFERRLSDEWTVGAGGLLEVSEIDEGGPDGATRYLLAGLPTYADYDGSNDLLNPTEGARLRLEATPFVGRSDDGETPLFTRLQATGAAYLPLDDQRLYVLAGRGRIGTVLAEQASDVPANRRLFSGGGGSVRGYAQDAIGPLDANGDPVGGLSVLELGTELRAQVYDPVGVALFVEGGAVSEEAWPSFSDGAQFAAGAGLRYLSPVGPIRLDVGVPLNPRDSDDSFQVYLSIGQAY